jgi:hypothetical protein
MTLEQAPLGIPQIKQEDSQSASIRFTAKIQKPTVLLLLMPYYFRIKELTSNFNWSGAENAQRLR